MAAFISENFVQKWMEKYESSRVTRDDNADCCKTAGYLHKSETTCLMC